MFFDFCLSHEQTSHYTPGTFSKRKAMAQIIKNYVPESKQANQCSGSVFCTPWLPFN